MIMATFIINYPKSKKSAKAEKGWVPSQSSPEVMCKGKQVDNNEDSSRDSEGWT